MTRRAIQSIDPVSNASAIAAREIVHQSATSLIVRLRLASGASVIYKEPLGPNAAQRLQRESGILARLDGVAGVPRLAPRPQQGTVLALEHDCGIAVVIKEFAQVPVVSLDRARVLQILVNLISNAGSALQGIIDRPRRLTLQVDVTQGCLRVRVRDEGEGILPENLTRIFSHGFTTRKEGHGFGLHSCALAAREMGGILFAHSDGAGRGAVFTLHLPIDPAYAEPMNRAAIAPSES